MSGQEVMIIKFPLLIKSFQRRICSALILNLKREVLVAFPNQIFFRLQLATTMLLQMSMLLCQKVLPQTGFAWGRVLAGMTCVDLICHFAVFGSYRHIKQ